MRLINGSFTKLFYGQAVSYVGDYVFDTGVVLWISTVLIPHGSYAPAAVSGVMIAVAVGVLTVSPVAGVFVDRWDKRRTMLVADLLRAVLIGLLALVASLPAGSLPTGVVLALVYAVVLLATAAAQFFNAARFAFVSGLVAEDERARATGILQATGYTAAIVGPPLAAPLLFGLGASWTLVVNALSFAASFAMVRAVRPAVVESRPAAPPDGTAQASALTRFLAELWEGVQVVTRNQVLRVLVGTLAVLTLGAATLNSLNVFFVPRNLHADASWFGTIGMGEGVGAVIGALSGGWLCRRFRDVTVYGVGLALVGAGLAVYARAGTLWAAILVIALIGLPLGAINTALSPILLRATPQEYIGRVISTFGPVQQLASMVSAVATGWLMSTGWPDFQGTVAGMSVGPIDTLYSVGAVAIVASGLYAVIALRSSDAPAVAPASAPGAVAGATAD
jgi:MFS family permease